MTSVTAVTSSLALAAVFLAYIAFGAFDWSQRNVDSAIQAEFDYLLKLHQTRGIDAVSDYLQARGTAAANSLLCSVLLDAQGNVIAGSNVEAVFPVPNTPGEPLRFTRETDTRNYASSPFNLRLDGLIERVSDKHAIGVATCHYRPPLFYGVYRTFFTPAPDLYARQ